MVRWWNRFHNRNRDRALDQEIAFHIEELTAANIAAGMPPDEARRRAMVEFGGRQQIKEELRVVYASALIDGIAFNLKAAMRFLRRSPSFSAAVILILALAIGSNSAVFSVVNAVVLRPLPFPHGDELVALYQNDVKERTTNRFVSPARLEDWNRMNSSFQSISGYYFDDVSETSGPLPEKVTVADVAPRFFRTMGVSPMLGRDFTPEEEHVGGPNAVVISYRFWQRRFHGAPDVLDRKIHQGDYSFSIVGVMPPQFAFPSREVDVWSPSAPDAPYALSRDATWFNVIGRLKSGVTLRKAQADLAVVQKQLGKQFPKPDADLTVGGTLLKQTVVGSVQASLWLLYGSVSVLLLIACSNIAALLLARTADREHEMAVRFSLGAPRSTIIVQLLTEVFVLAASGSLLGLLVAAGASRAFHLLSNILPRAEEITLNWRIVLYSLACAAITTILCGLLPAIRGTRRQLARSLAHTSRTQAHGGNPVQWTLVGVQVALAVTLLTGAGLLLRSLDALTHVSPGFDPGHVLTFQITGSWGETTDMKRLFERMDRTLVGLRTLPGVEAAATAGDLPGVPLLFQYEFTIDGKSDPNRKILAYTRAVSAGYFTTMRIPLLTGEGCKDGAATGDLVVNQSFADLYMNNTTPFGHRLQSLVDGSLFPQYTIRAVAADAREEGINTPPAPMVYSCYSAPGPFPHVLVRTHGDPMAMAETIRRRIHELEPGRSVYGTAPLQVYLDDMGFETRLRTLLITLFAGSAVLLACIGLYGTLNYLGRLRRREVGVRLALGALPGQIVRMFLGQGLRITVVGCAAGLVLSLGANRLLISMLYGVSALDPETYIFVPLLFLLVALAASLLPAWKAARVEPTRVLRQE
jgi:predicted permease